jgi:hypothetical protein
VSVLSYFYTHQHYSQPLAVRLGRALSLGSKLLVAGRHRSVVGARLVSALRLRSLVGFGHLIVADFLVFARYLGLFVVGLDHWALEDCFVLAPSLTRLVGLGGSPAEDHFVPDPSSTTLAVDLGHSIVADLLVYALVLALLAVDLGHSILEVCFALALGLGPLDAGLGS